MDWFIILLIIGFAIVIFCIGYIFGLIKNKELDKKYFEDYKKDMRFASGYQPKSSPNEIIPPKSSSNAIKENNMDPLEKYNINDNYNSILIPFIFNNIVDYNDFIKLFEKYRNKIFKTKYTEYIPKKAEISDKMLIKYDGVSCLIKFIEMRKDKIKYNFLNDIIDYLIMSFMKQDGYLYIENGKIFITDKGKEYIKEK